MRGAFFVSAGSIMPDLFTIPADILTREANSNLAGFFTTSANMAASADTRLTAMEEQPLHAARRQDAGYAIVERAFQYKALANVSLDSAKDALLRYISIITPSVFIQDNTRYACFGPALAYDLLKDDMSSADRTTYLTWADQCINALYSQLLTEPTAFVPGTPFLYGAATAYRVGGLGVLIVSSGLTKTTELAACVSAYESYQTLGWGADGDPKEEGTFYPYAGLSDALWFGSQVWDMSEWTQLATYLSWLAYPGSTVHGIKCPAVGGTNNAAAMVGDFIWRLNESSLSNLFRLHPGAFSRQPMSACMWAPATGTPATPGTPGAFDYKVFTKSRQMIVRQDSDSASDFYALIHLGGEWGPGRAHPDRGQVILHAKGRPWLFDPGGLSDSPIPQEAADHAETLIDGVGQGFYPHIATFGTPVDDSIATVIKCNLKKAYDYKTQGVNTPGYALDADGLWSASHNPVQFAYRTVAVVKRDGMPAPYLVVYDQIRKDNGSHTYKMQFPLPTALQFVADRIVQKVAYQPGLKILLPGTGANGDLNLTAGQLKGIGQYVSQSPSNYNFRITYGDASTQQLFPYAGDNYGWTAHDALTQSINNITKLVPIGRPAVLVTSPVSAPSGWTAINDPNVFAECLVFNLGAGTIGSTARFFSSRPGTMLHVTQTAVEPDLRMMFVPKLNSLSAAGDAAIEEPQVTAISSTQTRVYWPVSGDVQVLTFGGDAGIVVTEGEVPITTTTYRPRPLKGKRK